jgi:hypothetical protein
MNSLADLAAALVEETLLALGVTRAVTGSVQTDRSAQAPLRRLLLRIVAVLWLLGLGAWLISGLSSGGPMRSRLVVVGYLALGIALAALLGWAASFGAVRSGTRKSQGRGA